MEIFVSIQIRRSDLDFQIICASRDVKMSENIFDRVSFLSKNHFDIIGAADMVFHRAFKSGDEFISAVFVGEEKNLFHVIFRIVNSRLKCFKHFSGGGTKREEIGFQILPGCSKYA